MGEREKQQVHNYHLALEEAKSEIEDLKRTPQIKRAMTWLRCRIEETGSKEKKEAYRETLSKLRKGEFDGRSEKM